MAKKKENSSIAKELSKGVLAGDIAKLSRSITLAESTHPDHRKLAEEILKTVLKKTGNSFRLGITGVPGVGKSTFIESFGMELVKRGHKVAVLAVDPSSNKSKGSILGDKTRMEQLSKEKNVYIRPSPSSGTLGGIARATYESILLCEAAGYDFIIIETVGVGQSEVAVSKICDFFLLLMLAGAGDELQGIKRGIMEMADSMVITKADGNNLEKAKAARTDFARAMHFLQAPESGFTPRVEICSSLEGMGIEQVYEMLMSYRTHAKANGYFLAKRKKQTHELLLSSIEEILNERLHASKKVAAELRKIRSGSKMLPFEGANRIVELFLKGKKS
jgi:LAO/AO transport system kinase